MYKFEINEIVYVLAPGTADKFWECKIIERRPEAGLSGPGPCYDLQSGEIMDLWVSECKIVSRDELELVRNTRRV